MKLWVREPLSIFLQQQIQIVSDELQFEMVDTVPRTENYLMLETKGLSFVDEILGELHLDFLGDHLSYARKSHRGKSELIAKALGLPKGIDQVFDATMGLAQDAWFLVRLGVKVIGCERSPVLFLLLQDAFQRAQSQYPQVALEIHFANAIDFLSTISQAPQAIYLDPMFPDKKKSALPRREMQIFRKLVGDDADATKLFETAIAVTTNRVVVKRPLKVPPLAPGVIHSFEGTTVRYDLYSGKR